MGDVGVFLIEDGESHWVVARSHADAMGLHRKSIGYSEEEYNEEFGDSFTVRRMGGYEEIVITIGDYTVLRDDLPGYPSTAIVRVHTTAADWSAERFRGVIATTCV